MDDTLRDQNTPDDLNGRFLTFYLQECVYGIELFNVIEIVQLQPIMRVPGVAPYIKGVINLRGKIVPVIDVRLKFGYPETSYDDKTCIIVVVINDMQVGLIVDRVSEVSTIGQADCTPPPHNGSGNGGANQFLSAIASVGGRIVMTIDCQKFFASDLSIVEIR